MCVKIPFAQVTVRHDQLWSWCIYSVFYDLVTFCTSFFVMIIWPNNLMDSDVTDLPKNLLIAVT